MAAKPAINISTLAEDLEKLVKVLNALEKGGEKDKLTETFVQVGQAIEKMPSGENKELAAAIYLANLSELTPGTEVKQKAFYQYLKNIGKYKDTTWDDRLQQFYVKFSKNLKAASKKALNTMLSTKKTNAGSFFTAILKKAGKAHIDEYSEIIKEKYGKNANAWTRNAKKELGLDSGNNNTLTIEDIKQIIREAGYNEEQDGDLDEMDDDTIMAIWESMQLNGGNEENHGNNNAAALEAALKASLAKAPSNKNSPKIAKNSARAEAYYAAGRARCRAANIFADRANVLTDINAVNAAIAAAYPARAGNDDQVPLSTSSTPYSTVIADKCAAGGGAAAARPGLCDFINKDAGGRNFTCFIQSFLTATCPYYRKLNADEREQVAIDFRFCILLELTHQLRLGEERLRVVSNPGIFLEDADAQTIANVYGFGLVILEGSKTDVQAGLGQVRMPTSAIYVRPQVPQRNAGGAFQFLPDGRVRAQEGVPERVVFIFNRGNRHFEPLKRPPGGAAGGEAVIDPYQATDEMARELAGEITSQVPEVKQYDIEEGMLVRYRGRDYRVIQRKRRQHNYSRREINASDPSSTSVLVIPADSYEAFLTKYRPPEGQTTLKDRQIEAALLEYNPENEPNAEASRRLRNTQGIFLRNLEHAGAAAARGADGAPANEPNLLFFPKAPNVNTMSRDEYIQAILNNPNKVFQELKEAGLSNSNLRNQAGNVWNAAAAKRASQKAGGRRKTSKLRRSKRRQTRHRK